MFIEPRGYVVTKVSLHTIGFFDFIQDVSSFAACDEDAVYLSWSAAANPSDLNPAISIQSLVAMSYFCCEILVMQHAELILATNGNINQSGSSHSSISNQDSSCKDTLH